MISRSHLACLLLCLLCTPLLARPGTIRTKDGRSIEGDITDRGAEGATISTRAGQITIRADEIAEIQYGGSIKEAYEKRVAALPKDAGARAHFEIARWLYDNRNWTPPSPWIRISKMPSLSDRPWTEPCFLRSALILRGRTPAHQQPPAQGRPNPAPPLAAWPSKTGIY